MVHEKTEYVAAGVRQQIQALETLLAQLAFEPLSHKQLESAIRKAEQDLRALRQTF